MRWQVLNPKEQTNAIMTHFPPPLLPSFCHLNLRPIWLHNHGFRKNPFVSGWTGLAMQLELENKSLLCSQSRLNWIESGRFHLSRTDFRMRLCSLMLYLSSLYCNGWSFVWYTVMIVSLGKEDQLTQAWLCTHRPRHESEVQPAGSAAGLFSGGRVWSGPENHLWSKTFSPQETFAMYYNIVIMFKTNHIMKVFYLASFSAVLVSYRCITKVYIRNIQK